MLEFDLIVQNKSFNLYQDGFLSDRQKNHKCCVEEDLPIIFSKCEKEYFNYFMKASNELLESIICILPIGSILFHSSSSEIIKKKELKSGNFM